MSSQCYLKHKTKPKPMRKKRIWSRRIELIYKVAIANRNSISLVLKFPLFGAPRTTKPCDRIHHVSCFIDPLSVCKAAHGNNRLMYFKKKMFSFFCYWCLHTNWSENGWDKVLDDHKKKCTIHSLSDYRCSPRETLIRIKSRSGNPSILCVLKEKSITTTSKTCIPLWDLQ